MANQRSTFAKRQREQNKKDKAKAKAERLDARRGNADPNAPVQKGPPMGEPQVIEPSPIVPALPPPDVGVAANTATPATPASSPNPSRPSAPVAPRPNGTGSRPSNG
jgi:hypothetical protein